MKRIMNNDAAPRPIRKSFFVLSGVLIVSLFISSCLKNTGSQNTGPKNVLVGFTSQTISISDIDSGYVVFSKPGATPVLKRLQNGGNVLQTNLDDLSDGTWIGEITMYSKKDTGARSYQYQVRLAFAPEQINGILLLAPTLAPTDSWIRSRVLTASSNEVIAIVPLDLSNPSFEIRTAGAQWDSLFVKKEAFRKEGGNNNSIASDTWSCNNNCLGNDRIVYDSLAFKSFSQTVKNNNWNNAAVTVTVTDKDTQTSYELHDAWDK